jgi:hypothetical protein
MYLQFRNHHFYGDIQKIYENAIFRLTPYGFQWLLPSGHLIANQATIGLAHINFQFDTSSNICKIISRLIELARTL